MNESNGWCPLSHTFISKAARWGVSFTLVGILLLFTDLREVYRTLQSVNILFLIAAVGISFGDRLLMAGKWFPLLRVQLPEVSLGQTIRSYFASGFAGIFLPASGGDLLRSIGLGRDRDAVMEVGASVVMERLLGLIGSGAITLVVIWVALKASIPVGILLPWALACVGVSLIFAAVPFSASVRQSLKNILSRFKSKRWVSLIERFGGAYETYRKHTKMLLIVGGLSIVEQFAPVVVFWAAAQALQLSLSLEALFVAVPLTIFAARLPISVAGIGVVEGGLVYLLGLFGVPSSHAISLAITDRIIEILTMIPGAFWWKELTGGGWR